MEEPLDPARLPGGSPKAFLANVQIHGITHHTSAAA
jgi:hypothetical protein